MVYKIAAASWLLLLLCLGAGSASAAVFTARYLLEPLFAFQTEHAIDYLRLPKDPGMGWLVYKHQDNVPTLTNELITEESLFDISEFERGATTIIPVVPVTLYLRYASRDLEEREAEGSRIFRRGPPPVPIFLRLLFPKVVAPHKLGLIQEQGRRVPAAGWGVLEFLFVEEGLFSGEEWSWDNFMPRLLSVAALVVTGLLFIEFLRVVVLLGLRAFRSSSGHRS